MKNVLKIDFTKRKIIMDRMFAKLVEDTSSPEYDQLQRVRQDYPDYKVEQKHIRKNPSKKTYSGLTYDYMEGYILAHGTSEIAREFFHMREISECQTKAQRYPVIKSWFLDKFPEIVQFGVIEDVETANQVTAPNESKPAKVEKPNKVDPETELTKNVA